jgi:hypothetical protein
MLASQIAETMNTLGWDQQDNIVVEIGGTQVSGIHQGEEYNKKWASQYGDRKYNKDAFIVVKNLSRDDNTKSQPMDREHKPHHLRESTEPQPNSDLVTNNERLQQSESITKDDNLRTENNHGATT